MVRWSRPAGAVCAVLSGTQSVRRKGNAQPFAEADALAAIIDGRPGPYALRRSLLHPLRLFCPVNASRNPAVGVVPMTSCARSFAMPGYSIQNQGAGLLRPLRRAGYRLDRRPTSALPELSRPGHLTS